MATFEALDYLLLIVLIVASTAIGVYHACKSGKETSTSEFLLGNRNMTALPITFSLLATFVSGATLIGGPVEVYAFGSQPAYSIFGFFLMFPVVMYFVMPVYYELGVTSINEYLERRFNRGVRKFVAAIYIIQTVFFMAIIVYGPSLALNKATGYDLWICAPIIVLVCSVYTAIGGIRAVMWTDVLQIVFVMIALMVIIVAGFLQVGGFAKAMEISYEGNRVQAPSFGLDPRLRYSFWTQTIGALFATLPHYGINQAQVQRFLAAKSMKTARRALWGNMLGWIVITVLVTLEGFILYAKYHLCDPRTNDEIKKNDQLLPHFITNSLSHLTGFNGLFVACLLSGSLSTLSTGLNALAGVTYEDFLKAFGCVKIPESKATIVVKLIAFAYGGICLLGVKGIENFETITEAAFTVMGAIGGPILGVFILGMFFPWTNSKGAAIGLLLGLTESIWLAIAPVLARTKKPFLPISIEGCKVSNGTNFPMNFTTYDDTFYNSTSFYNYSTTSFASVVSTELQPPSEDDSFLNTIYSTSYMWYSTIACMIVIVSGLIISFITEPQNIQQLDPKLLSPLTKGIISRMSKKTRVKFNCDIMEEYEMETVQNGGNNKILIEKPELGTTC